MVIGVLYGGISGYVGGTTDIIMMRVVDILTGIPSLIYMILIMMFLGNTIQSILIAMCLTYWITTARMVRAPDTDPEGTRILPWQPRSAD